MREVFGNNAATELNDVKANSGCSYFGEVLFIALRCTMRKSFL